MTHSTRSTPNVEGPTTAEEWYVLGRGHFDAGRVEQALSAFDEAVALDPSHALARNGRGAVLVGQEKCEEALRELDEAIRLDPGLAKAYGNRGALHLHLGEYERARTDLDEAARLDPELDFVWSAKGQLALGTGDDLEAVAKELVRRSMQFHLERSDSSSIDMEDVEAALDELLFAGGSLNRRHLGAMVDGEEE